MTKETRKAFSNWRPGAVHLAFPNGNFLSTTWAHSSYSDNYNSSIEFPITEFKPMQSATCEIMFECGEKLAKKIYRLCDEEPDNSVIGWVTMEQWLKIVEWLAKEKKV